MNTEDWLKQICNTPFGPYLRPFAPNPKWQEAEVFVVGKNPATPLRDEFDTFHAFWESLTEFPDRFLAVYQTKHPAGASRTTTRVRMLTRWLSPQNVLVTNACSYPTARGQRIPTEQWMIGRQIFDRLVRCCKPKALLFYGADAVRLANDYFGTDLDPLARPEQQFSSVPIPRTESVAHLFACFHLTGQGLPRGYTVGNIDDYLKRFARQMRDMVGSQ